MTVKWKKWNHYCFKINGWDKRRLGFMVEMKVWISRVGQLLTMMAPAFPKETTITCFNTPLLHALGGDGP